MDPRQAGKESHFAHFKDRAIHALRDGTCAVSSVCNLDGPDYINGATVAVLAVHWSVIRVSRGS
ncbi:hypothetical protein Csa_021881 [Cucumis sativus]|uniref:Uncharacterized protein n=1 Tax=Cucumis sativus TaxID=3659 RepID=A0A0A0LNI0_CUCSA|nr:hypothetical protein Csa_021881 [Cucumis sativus]